MTIVEDHCQLSKRLPYEDDACPDGDGSPDKHAVGYFTFGLPTFVDDNAGKDRARTSAMNIRNSFMIYSLKGNTSVSPTRDGSVNYIK